MDEKRLARVYPIVIDKGVTHSDSRIPNWLREHTNIQHIVKPTIAARKINARLLEISWQFHPRLKERENIFVGRNSLVDEIEERFDDFRKLSPIVLVASGLPSIGRKAFLKYSTKKSNIVRDSYEYPLITLLQTDSIEDFVLKLHDLGFSNVADLNKRLHGSLTDKVALATEIVLQICQEKERVIIEDNGTIVQSDGNIVDWFVSIVNEAANEKYLLFCVASKLRPNKAINHKNESFYCVYVDELQPSEREGLFVRYSKFRELNLNTEELTFFSSLLTGFPEQVIYGVDLICDVGVFEAKKKSHEIQQYSSDKAKIILEKYSSKVDDLDFIYLLSKFEFLSYELIFTLVPEPDYAELLDKLLVNAICERLGTNGEYIRVNEVIRDFISRGRFGIPQKYIESINDHVNKYLRNYRDENEDLSDYLFSVQHAIASGNNEVPENLLIPSILIKTIKKLYDEDRNYKEAIRLCERVLQKEDTIHKNSIEHVRFIMCQSFARLSDSRFFKEVQNVKKTDKLFLFGFFYRISGQYEKSLGYLEDALLEKPSDIRIKGELVRVYIQTEQFERAFEIARKNYLDKPGNPININNYFTCLIHKEKTPENRIELEHAKLKLSMDTSERAQEMTLSADARLIAYYDNDYDRASDFRPLHEKKPEIAG